MTDPAVLASIVALHGATGVAALRDTVSVVQAGLLDRLGPAFVARPLDGVHATLCTLDDLGPWADLDAVVSPDGRPAAEVDQVVDVVRRWDGFPLHVQLGGFEDRDVGLRSRGARPHARTVTHSGGQVVLIGWPVVGGRPTTDLAGLRRALAEVGAVHRHGADDPDVHLVIGELAGTDDAVQGAMRWARDHLRRSPCRVDLSPEVISVVAATDRRLPADASRSAYLSRR